MPVPAAVAQAAEEFRLSNKFMTGLLNGLSPEEWLKRPEGAGNHITWLVGHLIWSRKSVVARLGGSWSAPWLGLFARGEKLDGTAAYPSPDALVGAWKDVTSALERALENATDEQVAQPAAQPGPPTADGKLSGTVRFMAWHETYHLGQISYVRVLLGHKGMMG
jgi:uncharacterized damage-inducible protein DinB